MPSQGTSSSAVAAETPQLPTPAEPPRWTTVPPGTAISYQHPVVNQQIFAQPSGLYLPVLVANGVADGPTTGVATGTPTVGDAGTAAGGVAAAADAPF